MLPRRCGHCEWSNTGAIGEAQPDNREQRQGGSDEACIGVLNNFYKVSSHSQPEPGGGGAGASMSQMDHFLSASQTEDKSFVETLRCHHDMRLLECIKSTRESRVW